MSKRETVLVEIARVPEEDLDRLLAYVRALTSDHEEKAIAMLAAESLLAQDWLTPEEDSAWATL